jgi:hypothetical protein
MGPRSDSGNTAAMSFWALPASRKPSLNVGFPSLHHTCSRLKGCTQCRNFNGCSKRIEVHAIIDPVRLVLAARIACTISGWPAAAGGARASGAPGYEVGRWGQVEAAGFKLVGEGDFWRHPEDTRDFTTQPPTKPADEFVLKFQKPLRGAMLQSRAGRSAGPRTSAEAAPRGSTHRHGTPRKSRPSTKAARR